LTTTASTKTPNIAFWKNRNTAHYIYNKGPGNLYGPTDSILKQFTTRTAQLPTGANSKQSTGINPWIHNDKYLNSQQFTSLSFHFRHGTNDERFTEKELTVRTFNRTKQIYLSLTANIATNTRSITFWKHGPDEVILQQTWPFPTLQIKTLSTLFLATTDDQHN
jgi:hypothetical protein